MFLLVWNSNGMIFLILFLLRWRRARGAAHLGHPYEAETVVVIRKHPNVYADISSLHYRPFHLYHSLMLVQEYGVWDKVLFGSDYPFTTVDASVAGLKALDEMLMAPRCRDCTARRADRCHDSSKCARYPRAGVKPVVQ